MEYRQCSDHPADRYSESSAHMPTILLRLTVVLCRGEYDAWMTFWFPDDCHTILPQMWVCSECATQGLLLTGFYRLYYIHRIALDKCCCICNAVGWAWHLQELSSIDLTETCCKSSSSLGCMPCINYPGRSWYFSFSPSWLSTFSTYGSPWWWRCNLQGVRLIVDDENTQLINELQRNSFSPAPISVPLTSRTMTYIWFPWLWYLALCGRSLHCVTQSGRRWNTSVNCDNIRQEGLSGTVLRCWSKLTCFTLRGELILWLLLFFWLKGRT
jgi:hypothetical protein